MRLGGGAHSTYKLPTLLIRQGSCLCPLCTTPISEGPRLSKQMSHTSPGFLQLHPPWQILEFPDSEHSLKYPPSQTHLLQVFFAAPPIPAFCTGLQLMAHSSPWSSLWVGWVGCNRVKVDKWRGDFKNKTVSLMFKWHTIYIIQFGKFWQMYMPGKSSWQSRRWA